MYRHVVLLSLADTATDEDRAAIVSNLSALPPMIPEILSYSVALNSGTADGNSDVAIVADFKDHADYETYASHEDHVAVINTYIKPFVVGRAAAQFILD